MSDQINTAADNEPDNAGERAANKPSILQSNSNELVNDTSNHRYECRNCGYIYDPDEGVKKVGIAKGTAFIELDANTFRCPVCRASPTAFKDIGSRDQPSGFEENLNYGFGANRLTSGQKNILIFGGLALMVSFFLSLYSLR